MNGIEAMHANVDRPRELAIRSSQASEHGEGRMLLIVTDSGVGLGDGATERIFTPFFTTKPSGLGMGLSICRSIIEAHAGRLSAFPNDGSGATFQIALPLPIEDTS
jgi:signal transduction histidine kinase